MPAYADDSHPGQTTLTPDQMQWKDAPGLPPGTKVTVIEGPMNEAVPFTIRSQVRSWREGAAALA